MKYILLIALVMVSGCGVRRGMTRADARQEVTPIKIEKEGDLETWTYLDWKSRPCQLYFFQGVAQGKARCTISAQDKERERNRAMVWAAQAAAPKSSSHCESHKDARGIVVTDCE